MLLKWITLCVHTSNTLLIHIPATVPVSARRPTNVQSLTLACLTDPVISAADLSARLLRVIGWGILNRIHDFHWPIIDLRKIVVFNRADSRGSFRVNDRSSTYIRSVLIHIKWGANKRTTLSKKLLQVLQSNNSCIDATHFQFALSKSALDLNNVGFVNWLHHSILGNSRSLCWSPSERSGVLIIRVLQMLGGRYVLHFEHFKQEKLLYLCFGDSFGPSFDDYSGWNC